MTTTNQTVLMAPPLTRTSCRPTRSRQHRPRYLLRDRDSIYGDEFTSRVGHMGIKEVKTRNRGRWSRHTKGKSSNSRRLAGFITATFGSRPSFSASRNALLNRQETCACSAPFPTDSRSLPVDSAQASPPALHAFSRSRPTARENGH